MSAAADPFESIKAHHLASLRRLPDPVAGNAWAHGTLEDDTSWAIGYICTCRHIPCHNNMHATASRRPLVTVKRDGWALRLVSGIHSVHKTRKAVLTCSDWREVPIAIDALGLALTATDGGS